MGQQTHDKAVHLSDMNSTQDPFMTSTLTSRGCLLARDNHEGLSFTCLFGSKKKSISSVSSHSSWPMTHYKTNTELLS